MRTGSGPGHEGAARSLGLAASLVLFLLAAACTQSVGEYNTVLRGDQAFARGEMDEALAEYRLAILQGSDDPGVYGRVAHTYALQGRVDDAAEHYHQAAAEDSSYADQAVADLVRLARASAERDDLFGVASAVQSALAFRPGLSVDELALPLARHYSRSGEFGRALPFYQKALGAAPADSAPALVYETAQAYEEVGDCGRALVFFEQYRETIPRWQRGEVNWHLGTCSYRYAERLKAQGRLEDALRHLETTIELEEPRNLLSLAHFDRGEVLSLLGDCEEAVEAYASVLEIDAGGTGPLVSRARSRIDEIRFGGYLEEFRPDERCGLPEPDFPDRRREPPDSPAPDTLRGLQRDTLDGR